MLNIPLKLALFSLLLSVISGCASFRPPAEDAQIATTQNWHMRGKLGVITPEQRLSANLHWRHLGRYGQEDLRLTNPFGGTVLSLNSQPGLATVELDGQHYTGTSPDSLILRLTGWPLPLSQLSQYLLGDPGDNTQLTYDQQGDPLRLELIHPETGERWQLDYKGWQQQAGHKVPRQLELRQGEQRIKLTISYWQPEP
ncbi:lipoprotein insertase outer membrane protein LolB [Ferrimonas pelagia]|uniref:Outer-membrane lipoprotein LolB n=1 Tax=Ferrimonas pelagia TaxID=1177826 RepID=A0ABP9EG79_9GAMM